MKTYKLAKLEKENEEIRELNKAQVLENAKFRVENAELKKKLAITKERVVEVLESPLGKDYKSECNLTRLKKLKEQIVNQIIGDDNND